MTEVFRYDGKRVLVVGCSSGIGAATARIVQALGGEVHGVGRTAPGYDLASFTLCDLRDPTQVEATIATFRGPMHSVFYNSGLMLTDPPLEIMKVNFAAMREVVEGVEPFVPPGGSIAVVSSIAGFEWMQHLQSISELLATSGFAGAMAWCEDHLDLVADGYLLSKRAAVVYTMKRAVELAHRGVRVNCFSPGPTDTPMLSEYLTRSSPDDFPLGPMNRTARVDEMGWPLAFLNSDAASYITGINLAVDGGFLASVMTANSEP